MNATPGEIEDAIVRARKELADGGEFNGPFSIADRLAAQGITPVPSRATIARILARRGLVRPQPRKRPRSSYRRFQAGRPNEMWQSDWTEWQLADGVTGRRPVAIAATLDDHSRLLVGISAGSGDGTSELVWAVMATAIGAYGVPMSSLTDNGLCYTTARRADHKPAAFQANLAALGCQSIASSPYHPQTCGKIERFWQTLKKWLRARPAAKTLDELNELLAQFRDFYNHQRPHRALRGATPAEVFIATEKACPADRPLPKPVFVGRHTVGNTSGNVHVAPYRIGVGLRWAGHHCDVIRQGNHVAIFSGTTLIRELIADPTRYHQPCASNTRTYRTREPKPAS